MAARKALGVLLLGLLVSVAGAAEPLRRHPTEVDGTAWQQMTDGEKLAFVTGFLAGAAAGQAAEAAAVPRGEEGDPKVPATVRALRQQRGLRFPFGPPVYKNQLDDYYWYRDRLPRPVLEALLELNQRFANPTRRPGD